MLMKRLTTALALILAPVVPAGIVAGEIAYDPAVTKAQTVGKSIVEYSNGHLKAQIVSLWESMLDALQRTNNKDRSWKT